MKTMQTRKRTIPLAAACGALLAVLPQGLQAAKETFPKHVIANVDLGQLVKGEMKGEKIEDQPITRTGVYLTAGGVYDDRMEVRLTTGGLFWYPLPELNTPSRRVRFGPGVGRAQGIYTFGDVKDPFGKLYLGLAPHKYNPDAVNLGEYLYRSGTYPGYLWTGGWSYLNSASYMSQGVRFYLPTFDGKVVHDFTAFMERDIAPTHNFSPGYEVTIRAGETLEFGGGMVWSHLIPLKDEEKIRPEVRVNAYNKATGLPLDLIDQSRTGYAIGDSMIVEAGDPRLGTTDQAGRRYVTLEENGTPRNLLGYYTHRGIKLMGRASLDFGALMDIEAIKPGQFKAYTEVALLGVENQPFYYAKRSERMPVMFGLNVPTFGLFDRLAVEMEYLKSRFGNQVGLLYDQGIPLPLTADGQDDPFAYSDSAVAADPGKFTKDDWKWSVYAARKITDGVRIHAQVASDHLRHFDTEVKPANTPSTVRLSDWYYVLRLEFGLY